MSGYEKMWLVKPELMGNKKEDSQSDYYQRQNVREKIKPDGSLVEILSHLQAKVNRVLKEPTTPAAAKIRKYNQLMNKSQILMRKAKTVGRSAYRMNPTSVQPPAEVEVEAEAEEERDTSDISDLETDSDDDTFFDTTPAPPVNAPPPPTAATPRPRAAVREGRDIRDDIKRTVPATYRENVHKLYNMLSDRAPGKGVNWNQEGELVINNQVVAGSNILELLTDAVRPKSRSKAPVGQQVFARVVKGLNPELKHVRNKLVFKLAGTPKKKTTPKKNPTQTGRGGPPPFTSFKWQTRL